MDRTGLSGMWVSANPRLRCDNPWDVEYLALVYPGVGGAMEQRNAMGMTL
jgi:hypothetical protein